MDKFAQIIGYVFMASGSVLLILGIWLGILYAGYELLKVSPFFVEAMKAVIAEKRKNKKPVGEDSLER